MLALLSPAGPMAPQNPPQAASGLPDSDFGLALDALVPASEADDGTAEAGGDPEVAEGKDAEKEDAADAAALIALPLLLPLAGPALPPAPSGDETALPAAAPKAVATAAAPVVPAAPEPAPPADEAPHAAAGPEAALTEGGGESPAPARPGGGGSESALRYQLAESPEGAAATAAAAGDAAPLAGAPPASAPPAAPATAPEAAPVTAQPPAAHQQTARHLAATLQEAGATLLGDSHRTELVLSPEELGRVHFEMRRQGEGLSVTLTAERPETLDLLRRHAPELKAELQAAGYEGATLEFGTSRQPPQEAAAPPPADEAAAPPATPASVSAPPAAPVAGGLDLRL